MQWLTPIRGTFNKSAKLRAAVATVRSAGPRPGPRENATKSTSSIVNPDSFRDCLIRWTKFFA